MAKRIAIVGGCGFIGHHLAGAIRKTGREVYVIDNLMVNNLYALEGVGSATASRSSDPWAERYKGFLTERLDYLEGLGVPILRISARDYDVLYQALSAIKPDLIFHLAAVAHITKGKEDPTGTFNNSIITLQHSLSCARQMETPVVYFSSSTAYGDFSQPVIQESEALTPKGIYGGFKVAGETLCRAYNQDYGLPVVIIRPQALYGPRCISRRVTQIFIERAIDGKDLTIHGTGEEQHDFTYIADLVQAMMLIVSQLNFHPGLERTWNVTGENATSLDKLAHIVADHYGVGIEYGEKDPDKPSRGTMSCAAIREELGYKPKYNIERGMAEYMRWYDEIMDR